MRGAEWDAVAGVARVSEDGADLRLAHRALAEDGHGAVGVDPGHGGRRRLGAEPAVDDEDVVGQQRRVELGDVAHQGAAGEVGAGGGERPGELAEGRGHRVRGDAHAHGAGGPGDLLGDVVPRREHQGQGPGPEVLHHPALGVARRERHPGEGDQVGDHQRQGLARGPALEGPEPRQGLGAVGEDEDPVGRLGGGDHEAPGHQVTHRPAYGGGEVRGQGGWRRLGLGIGHGVLAPQIAGLGAPVGIRAPGADGNAAGGRPPGQARDEVPRARAV